MYHNSLSFVIVSGSDKIAKTLREVQPLEDCSYSFRTVSCTENADKVGLDTAFIFDCTEKPLPSPLRDARTEYAAILNSDSPELSKAETVSNFGDIWVMHDRKYDCKLLKAYFSRLASRMKASADSRKQGICFHTLIDSVPDIAWYKDAAGAHLIVNDSFCNMVGKSKEQIYKKGHCYIWDATPEDEEVCLSSDRMIMESRRTNTFEEEVITKSEKLLLKSYKSPLIDENGRVFGTCGIARDVTEFRNATTEIQILLDSIPYVVLLEDTDEIVMSKNLLFNEYFPDFFNIKGKSSLEWKKSLNITSVPGTKQKEVVTYYGGEERTLLMEEEPLLDIFYRQNGKIITLADITDERKISKELEESKKKAQEANRAKSLFLANMSHEIRTPINSVIGMNEMILRESGEQETRSYALNARRSAKMLLGLINDILDFSKIETGKMELTPVNYTTAEVISDVVKMNISRANDKGLTLKLDVDPNLPSELYGDDVRLRQIISNLLTNAIKYTKEGTVTISVGGSVSEDGVLAMSVCVSDTGIGIKPEDIEKLFDAFQRIDNSVTRRIEGTGLGLNITMKLLMLMDSKLEVKSEYGKGSEFFFTVNQKIVDSTPMGTLEINAENADEFTYSASFAAPDAKVLMVDDNDMNRVVFRSLLKQTKVQVYEAASGYECLSLVEKEHFDIIFLDHMMPGMDGIETFHRIKEGENLCKDVPVIMLTANAVSGVREAYLEEGFTNFLSKPISPSQLEKMTKSYLPKELVKEVSECEEKAVKSSLPEIEGFNFEIARLYAKSDDIIKSSLEAFGDNLVKSAALLRHYLPIVRESEDNLELFRIQAHSLKGTAAIVGATQVSEIAKTAEFAAKAANYGRIEAITPILIEETEACLKRVEAAGVYTRKPLNPDISQLADKVKKILSLMEEFNVDEADVIMNELYGYSYPDDIQVQIEILKIAEVNCDIESIYKVISELERSSS